MSGPDEVLARNLYWRVSTHDVQLTSKAFLLNDENKTQLFDLMLRVWSSDYAASHPQSRNVMLVVQGRVFCLSSPDGLTVEHSEIHSRESNQ